MNNKERYEKLHQDKAYVKKAIACLKDQLKVATKDSVIAKLSRRIKEHEERL